MSGSGIGALIDMSRRSLFNNGQQLRIIGNNISNVNTEGYSRRRAELVTTVSGGATEEARGFGANIEKIVRITDKFLNAETEARIQDRSKFEVVDEILARAEVFFPVSGDDSSIGTELGSFFSALEDLAESPSDLALRQNVLAQGERLSQVIRTTYNGVAGLQREADGRVGSLVDSVNNLTGQIAGLNAQIQAEEVGEQEALALRDQREKLMRDLSELISFESVENTDNTTLIYLPNGFGLVIGSEARELEVTQSPDFAPVGGFPAGLDGSGLSHIVFDFDPASATTAHVDLTSLIGNGGGSLAGILQTRGIQSTADTSAFDAVGSLPEIAGAVEALARDLLTRFNTEYLGPDEDAGTAGLQPSSGDLNGNVPPGAYSLFSFAGAADVDADGQPDDLAALSASLGVEGFASRIEFGVTNLEDFAASRDLDPAAGATSFATGDAANIEALLGLRSVSNNFSLGAFNQTTAVEELYDNVVSRVGGLRGQSRNDLTVATDRETQAVEFRESVAGVSIDEEFANLIQIQRSFEASARMVRVADELLAEIIGLAG